MNGDIEFVIVENTDVEQDVIEDTVYIDYTFPLNGKVVTTENAYVSAHNDL